MLDKSFEKAFVFEQVSDAVEAVQKQLKLSSDTEIQIKTNYDFGKIKTISDLLGGPELSKKASIDWSKAPEQLELWAKEVEIHEQFAESQDLAKIFDLAEFELPRNRLDFMATDIQGQYPKKTLAEIRKDFWDIKESSQGEYADFVAELSKKYPKMKIHLDNDSLIRVAINLSYTFKNDTIKDDDEIAFFPPVSGG